MKRKESKNEKSMSVHPLHNLRLVVLQSSFCQQRIRASGTKRRRLQRAVNFWTTSTLQRLPRACEQAKKAPFQMIVLIRAADVKKFARQRREEEARPQRQCAHLKHERKDAPKTGYE